MDNNDILKKLRVALQYRDTDIQRIIKLGGMSVSTSELGALFRNPDHPNYRPCGDQILRNFLNGLVIEKRGKMEQKEKPRDTNSRRFQDKKKAGFQNKKKEDGFRDKNKSFSDRIKKTKK